jgi:hypothetical protein
MLQLKLPRPRRAVSEELPAALRWDAPRPSAASLISRRQFLKAAAVVIAAATMPLTRGRRALAAARGGFLTRPERATLAALCDAILPPDQHPGGDALGTPQYIDRLLAAFERGRVPFVYAGGPFSGRTPFPDSRRGVPSRRRPRNAFKRFLPLSRLQELRWRAELYGTAQVQGTGFNDAALGPLIGLRDVYRHGLARVDELAQALAGGRFADLAAADRTRVFAMLRAPGAFPPDPRRDGARFIDLVVQHTIEGAFAPPEYGGNRRLAGWAMLELEGDNQPLGFSVFSTRDAGYHERGDHPMSTPDPADLAADGSLAPRPVSPEGEALQATIVSVTSVLPGEC